MMHVREAVIVEGRYDKAKLASLIDAVIVTTNGFTIYKDKEKCAYIRSLARERGIVILTDSDAAGRQIRNFLASFIPAEQIRHAYIPDVYGKERRKAAASKEGKLGVEGIPAEILLTALKNAGLAANTAADTVRLSPAELVALGLSGGTDSAEKRRTVLRALDLPENLTTKMLLRWVDTEEKRERLLEAAKKTQVDA